MEACSVSRPLAFDDDSTILDEIGDGASSGGIFSRVAQPKYTAKPVGSVTNSAELQRVLALPRRDLDPSRYEDLTPHFRKPGGTMRLLPLQNAGLIEAAIMQGLFAPLPCGDGKTLLSLLLPTALDAKRAVLLVPTRLVGKTEYEIKTVYSKHFNLPSITIVTYEQLSSQKDADILERLAPDLIIGDECHKLRHRRTGRWRRMDRFMKKHPECRYCWLSGTITSKSIRDYDHLIEAALRKSSPLARGWREVSDWAGAIDVKPEYVMRPGALMKLCAENENVREGYARRLIQSKGVITTSKPSIGTSLVLRKLMPKIPSRVQDVLDEVRKSWSIEGNKFSDILTQHAYLRQVACGFYYRWVWPGGVPDYEWLAARSAWKTAAGEKLQHPRQGMDTEGLLALAADRWLRGKHEGVVWNCPAWADWKAVKDRPEPPKETVWIDDWLCRDALARAEEHAKGSADKEPAPCIIWVEHTAIGAKLAELAGRTYYGQGSSALGVDQDFLIASRRVHSEGNNFQHHYGSCLFFVACSGAEMEQTLARIHRPGQERDEVEAGYYGHTPELLGAMKNAKAQAIYQQETFKQRQKLLYATFVD